MKIDELISELEYIKQKHGNRNVVMMAPERGSHSIKDFEILKDLVRIYPENID